jgi:hypothetical protein
MSYSDPKKLWNDLMLIWKYKRDLLMKQQRNKFLTFYKDIALTISSEDNSFQVTYNSSNWEIGREHELTFLIEKGYNLVSMWGDDSDGTNFRIVGHYYGSKLTDGGVLNLSYKALCPIIRELKLQELGI